MEQNQSGSLNAERVRTKAGMSWIAPNCPLATSAKPSVDHDAHAIRRARDRFPESEVSTGALPKERDGLPASCSDVILMDELETFT